jgi:primosomal protein N' (replication factor Y) (superfamily II helicase)
MKASLKTSDFKIKKIDKVVDANFFSPAFMAACRQTADYYATSIGTVVSTVTPKAILDNLESTPTTTKVLPEEKGLGSNLKQEKYVLQEPDQERIAYYKSLIREAFAKQTSVFFCLPTIPEIERAIGSLEKGIADYTVVLHSELTRKKLLENWKQAVTSEHPVLIIATPGFLGLPRSDVKTLIVDRASSGAYKQFVRPFIDIRTFANHYASEAKVRLILGDSALPSEAIYLTERGDFLPISPLKYRAFSEAEQLLLDHSADKTEEKRFSALGLSLKEIINQSIINNDRLAIITARKGLYPTTVCGDCETVITCPTCHSPLVVYQTQSPNSEKKENVFVCNKCGQDKEIADNCPSCGSWRLALLGIGIERIEQELAASFPDLKIFKLDSDTIKTGKKARDLCQKFLASPGSVLLGTEMATHYLQDKIENVAFVGFDSMFSLPDFRISEKVFGLLLRMRELATKRFIIQTRNPEEKVYHFATKGNLLDFYREEIGERKIFGYPPFSTLIKISLEGKRPEVESVMAALAERLLRYKPTIFPAFTPEARGKYRLHALITLPTDAWPQTELVDELINLPPIFTVDVNPESIL